MAYTPDKCLSELKKVIDKLREVKFKDIIKAEDDNLKIDALKWIEKTLKSMSDKFTYGDYLSKISNLISKLKYVKDCPYDYEECLKHPEYFVYSDLHRDIITTLKNVVNALKSMYPPCEPAQSYINILNSLIKLLWFPRVGDIVGSGLHNSIRSILRSIYDTLKLIYEECYLKLPVLPYWLWLNGFGDYEHTKTYKFHPIIGEGNQLIFEIKNKLQIDYYVSSASFQAIDHLIYIATLQDVSYRNIIFRTPNYLYLLNGSTFEIEKQWQLSDLAGGNNFIGFGIAKIRKDKIGDIVIVYSLPPQYKDNQYVVELKCYVMDVNRNLYWLVTLGDCPYYFNSYYNPRFDCFIYGYDIDGDDKDEIIISIIVEATKPFTRFIGRQFIILDDNGEKIFEYPSPAFNFPKTPFGARNFQFVISDINEDDIVEMVILNTDSIECFELKNFSKIWKIDIIPPLGHSYNPTHIVFAKNLQRIIVHVMEQYFVGTTYYLDAFLYIITPDGQIEKTIYTYQGNSTLNINIYNILVCDIDNDDYEEIVMPYLPDFIIVDINDNKINVVIDYTDEQIQNYDSISYAIAVDTDNDGYFEIVGSSFNGYYLWVVNPRTGDYFIIDLYGRGIQGAILLACGDINNDGSAEIIIDGKENDIYYIYNIYLYAPI